MARNEPGLLAERRKLGYLLVYESAPLGEHAS